MANNVGNISVKLGMDSTAFRDAINAVGADASKFTNKIESLGGDAVEAMGTGLNSRRGKLTNTLNQLAFGFEDFASQLSTGGIGAGIRATANNASMIASAFGPVALITTVIGTTLASLIVPKMVEWLGLTDQLADKIELVGNRMKYNLDRTEEIYRAEQRFSQITGSDQQEKARKELEGEVNLRERQLKLIRDERERLNQIAKEYEGIKSILADRAAFDVFGDTAEGKRLDEIAGRMRAAFGNEGKIDPVLQALDEQYQQLQKQLEKDLTKLQVFERVTGEKGSILAPQNLSPIASDLSGTQAAFSSILRSVTQSNMEKTDQQIEANTKQTAQAVIDMNNREKDSLASTSSTNRIVITTIGEVV